MKKKEGYTRLLLILNDLCKDRKKAALSKIADKQKMFMSYNLFNLLLNNFGKIFQNNINRKLQYSFSKLYYYSQYKDGGVIKYQQSQSLQILAPPPHQLQHHSSLNNTARDLNFRSTSQAHSRQSSAGKYQN